MLDWNKLLSQKRLGIEEDGDSENHNFSRSQFQRDYDRIIFSSPFRRLQNKTQVFPLPGSIFVHNRLTHSLEVASVGRSLGNIIALGLIDKKIIDGDKYLYEIGSIVSSACLAHDLGNPPFGHSGEDAISKYFIERLPDHIKQKLTEAQLEDFCNFEGNANALRLLTHQFTGRRKGGFSLTYSTLATILKYPCTSISAKKENRRYEKYGVFQSEVPVFKKITEELGLISLSNEELLYARHPLVYLMEAADDICYQVIDLEDAHRLNIASTEKSKELLLAFFDPQENKKSLNALLGLLKNIEDENEQITLLRSRVINKLIEDCIQVFWNNYSEIMNGTFKGSLTSNLTGASKQALDELKQHAFSKIYNARSVVEIQVAGHKILGELLDEFINAVIYPESLFARQLLMLRPSQLICKDDNTYNLIMSVVDFIAGMTDVYALEVYRKIKGISFSVVR